MTVVLIVLLCIFLLLGLLCLLPVKAKGGYHEGGFTLKVAFGPFSKQIVPSEGKTHKRSKKERAQGEQKEETPGPGSFSKFRKLLPVVCRAAGDVRKKLRVEDLQLHVIWGGPDPATAAIGYGAAHGVVGLLWAALEENFSIKKHEIQIDLDYQQRQPVVTMQAVLALTLGQLLAFMVRFLWLTAKEQTGDGQARRKNRRRVNDERKESSHQ